MSWSSRQVLWALLAAATLAGSACSTSSGGEGHDSGPQGGSSGGGASAGGAAGMNIAGGAGSLLGGAGGLSIDDGGDAVDPSDAALVPEGTCGQSTIVATSRPVSVLLVIDRSGSMSSTPPSFTTDKWSAMKTAVSGLLNDVKDISFGLELFPNSLTTPIPSDCLARCWEMPAGDSAVVVPVAAGAAHVATIVTKLETTPSGGTPTASALKAAYDYYVTGAGQALAGDRYVLLATDGGPNGAVGASCDRAGCTTNIDRGDLTATQPNYCDPLLGDPEAARSCLDEAGAVAQLAALAGAGIKTFVIGIPGTEPYVPTLDHFAVVGGAPAPGTPRYYAVSAAGGVAGLTATFTSIARHLITSCNLQLQTTPPDLQKLNVAVDGTVIRQGPDGWVLDLGASPPSIVLQGATCDKVQAVGAQSVQVLFGCPTAVIN